MKKFLFLLALSCAALDDAAVLDTANIDNLTGLKGMVKFSLGHPATMNDVKIDNAMA
jgi:hypothetical protein